MTGYSNEQLIRIQEWNNRQKIPVSLICVLPGTEQDQSFDHLSEYLETIAPNIRVTRENQVSQGGWSGLPGLLFKKNIFYSALPYERELDPFLAALDWIKCPDPLDPDVGPLLGRIEFPVPMKLYIAQACPHCPILVRTVMGMAMQCEMIQFEIIDGTVFPVSAQKDSVMAAPCLILDNDFRWTGQVSALEIAQMIVNRDASGLSVQSLKTILEDGRASWIAGQMMDKGHIFESFYGLLLHETWSVRLGAMVIVEELSEKSPALAGQMCDRLLAEFDGKAVTVQGDILYALGEAGDGKTIRHIEALLETVEDQDVKDAAPKPLTV